MIFFPPGSTTLLATGSYSIGFLSALIVISALLFIKIDSRAKDTNTDAQFATGLVIIVSIFLHFIVISTGWPVDFTRFSLSLALAAGAILLAPRIQSLLFITHCDIVATAFNALRYVFVAIFILSIAGIQPGLPGLNTVKPAFPFTEPSHAALVFAPLLIHACVIKKLYEKIAWLAVTVTIAIMLQSLTLVLVTLIAALVSLPLWISAVGALAAFAGSNMLNLAYYSDRLDFTSDNANLSALVYRQGWELAYESLDYSKGLGLGFQQLGSAPIYSYTSDLIYRILGNDLNMIDGGFTAAKLIAEFGILGIMIVCWFAWNCVKAVVILRNASLQDTELDTGLILCCSIICGYSIEMFTRGVGYFSGTTFLVLCSLMYLNSLAKQRLETVK